jgi:hypothetical protein
MAQVKAAAGRAEAAARGAAREAAPWVERLARMGYAARGIVYVIVGVVAAQAARGEGGATGQQGAFSEILSRPGGKFMLGLLAVGLLGYAVWRFVEASIDPEHDGGGKRALYALSGVIHAGLALTAMRMALGSSRGGGGGSESLTARVMEAPAGRWLVAAAALAIVGFGIFQIVKGWRADLDRRLDFSRLPSGTQLWAVRAARAGLAARGVVFLVIGFFLFQAALQRDPGETRDLEGALDALHGASYGPWLLGLVALGLIAYGITEILKARYRRIKPA